MKNLTWKDFESCRTADKVALIPVGSMEQHGYHAPLGTDLYIAEELAALAKGHPKAILLPSVPVGVSDYHRDFPGSLWVKPGVLKRYVADIIESLLFHGICRIVVVNGHGGNREPLKEMARELELKHEKIKIIVWTWFESIEEQIIRQYGFRPPLHADEAETGMLLALRPESVQMNECRRSYEGASPVWGEIHNGTMISQRVRRFSASGATGNPEKTDPGVGERFKRLSMESLLELITYVSGLEL